MDASRNHDPQAQPVRRATALPDPQQHNRDAAPHDESFERFKKAISIETVGALFFRLDGGITDANDAFERMSGYTREELRNITHWNVLTPPEFTEVTMRRAEDLATVGTTPPYEKQLIRKDGSRWWGLFAPTRLSGTGWNSECMEFVIDINSSKRAEEELRRAREHYAKLFNLVREGFAHYKAIYDDSGILFDLQVLEINPAGAHLSGVARENQVGRTWREVWPGINEQRFTFYQRADETGEPVRFDDENELTGRVYEVVISRVEPGEFIVTFNDITGRKRSEQALMASEARLRATLQSIVDEVWIIDAEGRIVLVNDTVTEHLGVPPAHWPDIYTALAELQTFYPDGTPRPPDQAPLPRCLRGEVLRGELEIARNLQTGELRWREITGAPVRAPDGRIAGAVGVARDITDRKKIEEALRESERRLRELADSMPQLVWAADETGAITYVNRQLAEQIALPLEEVLGDAWVQVLHPEDRNKVLPYWRHCVETGERFQTEYRLRTSSGEYRWFLARGVPIRDEQGRLTRWYGTSTDIDDSKRAEERFRQAQKLESVGLLAGGIAHDFNNLLTGILGNASLALDSRLAPDAADRVRQVMSSAERAANLTRQLLAYSGKGQFIVREIDISQAVNDMADLMQFSIPDSIELSINVRRRLPTVQMDPGQLQQVLMNLVINAGEAIGEGNPGRIAVTTSLADIEKPFIDAAGQDVASGRYICIEVSDTGSGIDEGNKSRIFDPFFTTKFMGRGLGLAAVAGILRTQKGAITVDSAPGRGSTFRVYLPVAHAGAQATEEPPVAGRGTVLVVDDELVVREVIGTALRRQGYRVLTASDGREAVAVCGRESGSIDAAILDVVMPIMGAGELMPELKARYPEIRILLTSGYGEDEARRLSVAYPGSAFVQKPYTAQQIAEEVERLLK